MKKLRKLTLSQIIFSIIFLLFIILSIIEILGMIIFDLRVFLGVTNKKLGTLIHVANILCITALLLRSLSNEEKSKEENKE